MYTIQNRSLQFLVVELPPRAALWGVTLDGRPVSVGQSRSGTGDGLTLEIPIEYVGDASLDLRVGLRYEDAAEDLRVASSRDFSLRAPRAKNVQVIETVWTVHTPRGFDVWASGGNLRQIDASVQHEKKVENLLEQFSKIGKVASESGSRRQRRQAKRELERLEQELGDNLAELEESVQVEASRGVSVLQNDRQNVLIEKAQSAQRYNNDLRIEIEKKDTSAPSSQAERGFRNAARFMERGNWRGGRSSRKSSQRGPPTKSTLSAWTEDTPYLGLSGIRTRRLAFRAERVDEDALTVTGGLPAPDGGRFVGALPGLEARPSEGDGILLAFHRAGGDAELVLSQRKNGATARLAAQGILAALVLAGAWYAFGRRR